tara:strand:+ start:212 stop:448 length:237 start_codon:yes stop_codon:yes gene_type:complete
MRRNDRYCEVGDLLIREDSYERCIGLVTGVEEMKRIGSTSVFVEWTTDAPTDYHSEYGYSLINVHNQFGLFTIVKASE